MKNEVHVALIGCGRVAGRHVEAVLATEGITSIRVCDIDKERAIDKGRWESTPLSQLSRDACCSSRN